MKHSNAFALILLFLLSGCITTYRDFPVAGLDHPPEYRGQGTLYYLVKRFDILEFGGFNALNTAFRDNRLFEKTEKVVEPPAEGLYIEANVRWKRISTPALIFGYISVITLTFIPAWSTEDGYEVYFHVHRNGQKLKSFEYQITRKAGLWFLLLPFAWINFLTYDEDEVFTATANQFFEDARPILAFSQ
jgi:hypothetical protein